jgi:hypothetical protein
LRGGGAREDEWLKALRHDHGARMFGQAAVCEVWSALTIVFGKAVAFGLLGPGVSTPSLQRFSVAGFAPGDGNSGWEEAMRLAVLVATRLAAFLLARFVIRTRVQERVLDPRAFARYLASAVAPADPFGDEELRRCVRLDYPEHAAEEGAPPLEPPYPVRAFGSVYALAAILFVLFSVLAARGELRRAFYAK